MPYAPTIREGELKNKVAGRGLGQCGSTSAPVRWWRGSDASLRAFALAASTNYSIISLAPETFSAHQPIEIPAHPVMLVGEGGRATVESDAGTGAFVIDKGNDGQTLLRGLNIVLAARFSASRRWLCAA